MDVKRLKVTELRAELGRRGLDARGLKVELAQRLQEALDAEMLAAGPEEGAAAAATGAATGAAAGGACAGEPGPAAHEELPGGGDEEEEEEEEEEDEEALLADEEEAAAAEAAAEAPAGAEAPEPQPEAAADGVNGAERPPEEGPAGDEAAGAAGAKEEEEEEEEEEAAQAADGEEKPAAPGPDAERKGLKRQRDEKDEHGRAWHEFREEAYSSRSKSPPPPEEEPREGEEDETVVILDTYTSDLHFRASKDRYGGQPLFFEKFPSLWSGARSTHGVTKGKICFEAKVTQHLPAKEGSAELPLFRVGWSVDFSHSQLGEDEFSYGYDGRGLKVANGQFEEFGPPFGENDVIGCFANFEPPERVELWFSKNGRDVGVAFHVSKAALGARALLPHVLCRSCAVELNFGQREEPLGGAAPRGYVFLHAVPPAERVRAPPPPRSHEECEVLLMVGLPGAGKTHWAQRHSQEHREKRYNVLGTEAVLRQMRPRGPEAEPEPDAASREQLLQRAARCLSKLVQIAPRAKRNFILDQCNVYNSGQRRKLLAFKGFCRKGVVIVPTEEDWKKRLELRKEAEGEDVPESVMLEMRANFSVPEPGELLDEVVFGELGREAAQPLVAALRDDARKLLPPAEKRPNRRNNRNKRNRQNRSRGQGYAGGQRRGYDNRLYGQQPYWGQPGARGGYRSFYERYRGDYERFYGRDYEYGGGRYRDYYRHYGREWQNYYQDRDRYYRNYYGYPGYR
ncbi:LOW QUALITY PROTEIN: heterogeneous nuclear ribonucleoprotein U-like protein 2 [Eudromia elegans]